MTGPVRLAHPFLAWAPETQREARVARYVRLGETEDVAEAMHHAEKHRVFDCDQYDDCLMVAAVGNWRGWSCQGCERWTTTGGDSTSK